jgi:hypothetical protein
MVILRLTRIHEGKLVCVNASFISSFDRNSADTLTRIRFNDKGCIEVFETPDTICEMIKGSGRIPSFEEIDAKVAELRDPIVLSIRETRHLANIGDYEPFMFEVNGKPYLFGTLNECMESRHAYAAGCEQNGVPYTMTDLPEPHKSNLEDFHANPVVGGGLKAAEAIPSAPATEEEEEVENPNFIPEENAVYLGGLTLDQVIKSAGFYRSDVDETRVLAVGEFDIYMNQMSFPWGISRKLALGTWTAISEYEHNRIRERKAGA